MPRATEGHNQGIRNFVEDVKAVSVLTFSKIFKNTWFHVKL